MPITISGNADLQLQLVRFDGCVTYQELLALADAHQAHRSWAAADVINVVDEFSDLSDLMSAPMEDLRARYRALHLQLNFHVLRRSGWLCRSAQGWRIVEEWLRDRHSRDGQGTEVFLASDWPELLELFSRDELASAANGEGFVELARIAIARSG